MKHRGFTLVELVSTLTVVGITAAIAVPAMRNFVESNAAAAAINEFTASLQLARSEAVRNSRRTVVCKLDDASVACDDDAVWQDGWLVFTDVNADNDCTDADADGLCDEDDGRIWRIHDGLDTTLTIDGGNGNTGNRVVFNAMGYNDGYMGTFTLCSADSAGFQPRGIRLAASGRIHRADDPTSLSCEKEDDDDV